MESSDLKLDVARLKKAALTLRAVNHSLRKEILLLIHQMKKITVTEIYVKLKLEQSVASQHLAILRNAGFVKIERNGKFIYYSINYQKLNNVQDLSNELSTLK